MNFFLLLTILIIILGVILSSDNILITTIDSFLPINTDDIILSIMIYMNVLLLIFFLPSLLILVYA
jgi:hypothetical protein